MVISLAACLAMERSWVIMMMVEPLSCSCRNSSITAAPLAAAGGLTLVRVELGTGRSHQIRVQMKHAGYPLWGDNRYGSGRPGQQIALWAAHLAFDHPTTHERLSFDCPVPEAQPWNIWRICANGGIIRAEARAR